MIQSTGGGGAVKVEKKTSQIDPMQHFGLRSSLVGAKIFLPQNIIIGYVIPWLARCLAGEKESAMHAEM